jgi:hypothetical protein
MNTKTRIALIAVVVLSSAAVLWHIQFEGSTDALCERFPDIDPSIVRKVHKEMVRETLAGEYNDIELNDENCDEIFRAKAMLLTHE